MPSNIDLRMAEAIKLAKIAFFSYQFDGTILAMDRVAFDFFELEGIYENPESVIGESIESIFIYIGPKGRIREQIKKKRRISNLEYGIRTLKNHEKWGIHNSYVYTDEKTGEEAIQVCFYDITDLKMHEEEIIEQSEQRYKTLFEFSPDSIIILDMDNKIIECNKATVNLFELNYENIIGRRFDELQIIERDQAEKYMDMLQKMAKGEELAVIEIELLMKQGSTKWIESFPSLILHKGKPNSIQIISRNITDRKLAEIEMRKKLMKYELNPGNIYLSKEPRARQTIDAFNELLMVGHSGTIISRQSKKEYDSVKYKFNHVRVSEMDKEKHVLPKYAAIHDFLTGLARGEVVHIDCIEYLTSKMGPKKALNIIQYLKDLALSKNLFVLISVDPLAMSKVDMRLIEKESKNILPSKSLVALSPKLIDTLSYIDSMNKKGENPSYSDIGERFQLSKPTTRKRIKQLNELGTVKETKKGRTKILKITEKGKSYLAV